MKLLLSSQTKGLIFRAGRQIKSCKGQKCRSNRYIGEKMMEELMILRALAALFEQQRIEFRAESAQSRASNAP